MQLVITIGWPGSNKEIRKAGSRSNTSMRGLALLKRTLLTTKPRVAT